MTDMASCPLDWRLFLPASWDETTADTEQERLLIRQRRIRAQIPADVGHRPKWELACEMIDELGNWGVSPPRWSSRTLVMVTTDCFELR